MWVVLAECLLVVGVFMGPVMFLVGLVNLPGLLLTLTLRLYPWDPIFGPPAPHKLAAWILIFAVGSVFWVMIVWSILIKRHLD